LNFKTPAMNRMQPNLPLSRKVLSFSGSVVLATLLAVFSCSRRGPVTTDIPDMYSYNQEGKGIPLTLSFKRGPAHNYPLMAVWMEDTAGRFIQTLYISESIGKGIFHYGQATRGKWMPGEIRRPAAVPYWTHKRNIRTPEGELLPTPEHPVADTYTGPTPPQSFVMKLRTDRVPPSRFRILLEINQTWDWNEYWTNNKYPGDEEYRTSSQPALVYAAEIDLQDRRNEYPMVPVGHSHYSGRTGELFTDLSTLSTALDIASEIKVILEQAKN